MTHTLNDKEIAFIRGVRQAVEERGADFVYPTGVEAVEGGWRTAVDGSCLNRKIDGEVNRDEPTLPWRAGNPTNEGACIVGLGAVIAGLSIDYNGSADCTLPEALDVGSMYLHDGNPVILAAGAAQALQDNGKDWGTALVEFERHLEEAGIVVD